MRASGAAPRGVRPCAALLRLGLLGVAQAYISVTPEGNLTLYGPTAVGSWEATDVEPSDMYVTGNVVLGRLDDDLDSGRVMLGGGNATLLSTTGDISVVPAEKFVLEAARGDSVQVIQAPICSEPDDGEPGRPVNYPHPAWGESCYQNNGSATLVLQSSGDRWSPG